jgi:hypothetical protein
MKLSSALFTLQPNIEWSHSALCLLLNPKKLMTLFYLSNIGQSHFVLKIWNGVVSFYLAPKPNATILSRS